MKAVISSTFDDNYHFFIPVVTWCWYKLGVEVVCFVPNIKVPSDVGNNERIVEKAHLVEHYTKNSGIQFHGFNAPKNKEVTYAQCSRLYAACLDLPEDEILVTSDADMCLFKNIFGIVEDKFVVWGSDLVPKGQYPICYLEATVQNWRQTFKLIYGKLSEKKGVLAELGIKSYQKCLDDLFENDECLDFRGNRWSADQEKAFLHISKTDRFEMPRTNGSSPFSTHRLDRDDSYLLERLNLDIIDYHMPRPGYETKNFEQILTVLKYFYPNEDFQWLIDYRREYLKLM